MAGRAGPASVAGMARRKEWETIGSGEEKTKTKKGIGAEELQINIFSATSQQSVELKKMY